MMRMIFYSSMILWFISACKLTEVKKEITKSSEIKMDSIKVFVATADTAKKTLALPGDLLPNEHVMIRSKIPGYISRLSVDLGTHVSKGQTLTIVGAPEMNTQLQELSEKVNAAKSKYLSSKDYYDRILTASDVDGVIAKSELARTKNQMLSDSAAYNAFVLAASTYKQIGNYLAITAPFSGVITKRNIEVGSYVGAANEKALFELENNSTIKLNVPVPEIYTGASLQNNACEITTRSMPDKKFVAKLVRKTGSLDQSTRSEIWEFTIPNKEGTLKAGSYADVKMNFFRASNSILLPASAVVTTLEKRFVIKVADHTTQWIDVRTGFNMGDKIEVFGAMNAGDTLVLKPTEELKAGTKVVVKL